MRNTDLGNAEHCAPIPKIEHAEKHCSQAQMPENGEPSTNGEQWVCDEGQDLLNSRIIDIAYFDCTDGGFSTRGDEWLGNWFDAMQHGRSSDVAIT